MMISFGIKKMLLDYILNIENCFTRYYAFSICNFETGENINPFGF